MSWRDKVAAWATQLKVIGESGFAQAQTIYEKDNYRSFERLAAVMADTLNDKSANFTPLDQNVTPKISPASVADAAVIDEDGRLLLIRRADNNLWAMPGGALEVGETVSTGAVREAFEETGVRSQPVSLVGAWDSRLYEGFQSRFHMYQFVILCRPLAGAKINRDPSHVVEINDIRWFAEDDLPPQDEIDPGHRPRLPHVYRVWRGDHRPYFDPLNRNNLDNL